MPLDRPIFLIGAARSGTKIIGQTLAAHPALAFWDEPKYVWRHGDHGATHDARPPEAATPAVTAAIRERFEHFLRKSGRARFLEKTPSNCFRVRFMHRIFPDGLFLHVQRDGRDVAASALRRWCTKPDDGAIARRLRGWEIPLTATHHYLPDILREMLLRRLWPERGQLWGPRYPGLEQEWRGGGTDIATLCARQWAYSARTAALELARLPAAQVFSFRYEDFVQAPGAVIAAMLDFAGLPAAPAVYDQARRKVNADRIGGFASLSDLERHSIEQVCRPVMDELAAMQPASAAKEN